MDLKENSGENLNQDFEEGLKEYLKKCLEERRRMETSFKEKFESRLRAKPYRYGINERNAKQFKE